jgi:hypothetical protein
MVKTFETRALLEMQRKGFATPHLIDKGGAN